MILYSINLMGNVINYDIIQIAVLVGIILVIAINFKDEIMNKLGIKKYKMELGDSWWTFMGDDGVHYSNAKLIERKRNPFGNWNIKLSAIGGDISLPNVNMDTSSPDCNIKIINLSHAASGIVDVFCNIDALGKPCKWNYKFDEHKDNMMVEAKMNAAQELKKSIIESKEFSGKMSNDNNLSSMFPKGGDN